jgi:Ca2+/H+ antiporter, TMEM165/GDT1 family
MSGFLFAFIAAVLAGIGARDQLAVAGLAARNGQRVGLLAVAVLCAAITGVIAGWAAGMVVPLLEGNTRAGQLLIAVALGFAGAEMLVLGARPPPAEPTQSLGAAAIVLTAHQLTDAARFFIFAIAAATAAPIPAGVGGAVGGIAVVALGWIAAEDLPLKLASITRRILGVFALLLAVWFALQGLGRFG